MKSHQPGSGIVADIAPVWSGRPDSNQRPRRPEGEKVVFHKSNNDKYLLVLTEVKHC